MFTLYVLRYAKLRYQTTLNSEEIKPVVGVCSRYSCKGAKYTHGLTRGLEACRYRFRLRSLIDCSIRTNDCSIRVSQSFCKLIYQKIDRCMVAMPMEVTKVWSLAKISAKIQPDLSFTTAWHYYKLGNRTGYLFSIEYCYIINHPFPQHPVSYDWWL